jgi:hypothetical protein
MRDALLGEGMRSADAWYAAANYDYFMNCGDHADYFENE